MTNQLSFHNTNFNVIDRDNQIWLTASEVSQALGYADTRSVTKIYNRHSDEFTSCMSTVVSLGTVRKTGVVDMETRIFSLRGAHLIAMFARTEIAKEFRKWVLNVLDEETQPLATPVVELPDFARLRIMITVENGVTTQTKLLNDDELIVNRQNLDYYLRDPEIFPVEQLIKAHHSYNERLENFMRAKL